MRSPELLEVIYYQHYFPLAHQSLSCGGMWQPTPNTSNHLKTEIASPWYIQELHNGQQLPCSWVEDHNAESVTQ